MKNRSLIKKIGISATAGLLCLATSATCLSLAVPSVGSAFADEAASTPTVTPVSVATNISVPESCVYGEKFTVPAGATVYAPDGEEADVTDGKVEALQLGNYKVSFGTDVAYDFYVRVRLDEEFFLKVDYNGADIPSLIQTGKSFELPSAKVVYYDDNNILQEYPGKYTVTATDSRGGKYFDGDGNSTFEAGSTTGKVFITYDAQLGGIGDGASAEGAKHFSQTFGVNVQSQVNRTGTPTLSVSGVQKDVSINRAVTLPKATATDASDDNVKVVIEVTDPSGEKVKNVDIDENGYAYQKDGKTYADVLFDNDRAMTFYPLKTGTYKVTYTAYSDAYDPNGSGSVGKSSTREYYMTVSDLVAPVFKNVEEWRIPETWGLTVKDAEDNSVDNGGKITFTVPDVVDNKDHAVATGADDKDLISLYFRITDSDNSKTIVEFTNILAGDDSNDSKFTYTDTYNKEHKGDKVTFNKENPFTFDFNLYNKTNSTGENQTLPGTYTVLYRARDKANNTSSRTFTVTLQDTYTDSAAPTTAEVTVPDYISSADKTFTVPNASVADAADSRLKKVYRIYNNNGEKYDVLGGEVADIEDGKLIFNKGKEIESRFALTDKLYFYVSATDKAGNFKSNVIIDNKDVDLDAADVAADAYKQCDASLKVVGEDAGTITYSGTNMTLKDSGEITAGDNVTFKGFTITNSDKAMRKYTGYEVSVRDPQGNPLNVTLETTTKEATDSVTIYVQNIMFNAAVPTLEAEDKYTVTVRVFDVNGNNSVYAYTLTGVKKSTSGNGEASSATIGASGEVDVTYKLHNETIKGINGNEGDVYRVVRKISGGIFSLMGSEFTAKTQGSYTVSDGYINADEITENGFDYSKVTAAGSNNGVYNFNITDSSAPVLEVQGVMPTYKAFPTNEDDTPVKKEVEVVLPKIVAYTENGEAVVKIEVKDRNGGSVKFDKEKNSFIATMDGKYTVSVTATYANSTPATATYEISVGDVIGPEFKVEGGTNVAVTMTVGDKFEFGKMVLINSESGVEITKTLKDPSGETVADATVTGSFTSNADRVNNGTDIVLNMAGTYRVRYEAKDSVGNVSPLEFEITVVSKGSSTPTIWTGLSTALIVIAVVLLAGVIVYVVRFRKVKK